MPRSLATSGSELPAASLPSACRSLRMICSGECLLPNFESPPSAYGGLGDSHRNWIKSWGSGQGILERRESYLNAPYVVVLLIRGPRPIVSALLLILRPL